MMTPERFADSMRCICADKTADKDEVLRRALAHCMDALEGRGYGEGIAILHDRLDKDRPAPNTRRIQMEAL